ncbi:MAG: hypothetical protein R6X32_18225 [Chloroflexota bacterium]|jgi:hypothetical protein
MWKRIIIYPVLALLLVACGQATPNPTAVPAAAATPTAVSSGSGMVVPTATPTPQPSPTPEPTPIVPALTVSDQTLDEAGQLLIQQVVVPEASWLAVYNGETVDTRSLLGYTAVAAGLTANVTIAIDPYLTGDSLRFILYPQTDDTFQPETADPWLMDEEPVGATTAVTLDFPLPEIVVSDQELTPNEEIIIDRLYLPEDGWLVVHAVREGSSGEMLGFAFVEAGETEEIAIPIRWREATPRLQAVLYQDRGQPRHLELNEQDLPLLVGGQPLVADFNVVYPPDILVYDQPVVEGQIVIERVISNGPGWLVAYFDEEGEVGLIIGSAPLANGLNENVVLPLREAAVTETIYLMLHEDTNPGNEFDFPRNDQPVLYNGRLPTPFSLNTNPGRYLIGRDQPANDSVTIPIVVSDIDTWVVVYDNEALEEATILGHTWVPAGLQRDIIIELDEPAAAGTILYASLHVASGTADTLSYPNGPDIPLRRNNALIQVPFSITE